MKSRPHHADKTNKTSHHDPRMFKKHPKHDCVEQNVTVEVTVNEKQEDCITSCFKACFGLGKQAAKG